jgi:hypothetical protein
LVAFVESNTLHLLQDIKTHSDFVLTPVCCSNLQRGIPHLELTLASLCRSGMKNHPDTGSLVEE